MSKKNSSTSIGFPGLLTVLFICLKLTHYIDWPWFWVLSPLWIVAVMTVIFMALMAVIFLAAAFIKSRE